jgi:hypothetical protein
VNDSLRIDLALARAAGLPPRAANDASGPAILMSTAAAPADPLFSPLALLLARFLPDSSTPAPVPTPDETRLLHAYLQQRVVAVLRAADIVVPSTLRVEVGRDGALHLSPVPASQERLAPVLREAPDIARLVLVLRNATVDVVLQDGDDETPVGAMTSAVSRGSIIAPDARRAWPWRVGGDDTSATHLMTGAMPLVWAGSLLVVLLAWWLSR